MRYNHSEKRSELFVNTKTNLNTKTVSHYSLRGLPTLTSLEKKLYDGL